MSDVSWFYFSSLRNFYCNATFPRKNLIYAVKYIEPPPPPPGLSHSSNHLLFSLSNTSSSSIWGILFFPSPPFSFHLHILPLPHLGAFFLSEDLRSCSLSFSTTCKVPVQHVHARLQYNKSGSIKTCKGSSKTYKVPVKHVRFQ